MLVINKNANHKNVRGKKIRDESMIHVFLFTLPFVLLFPISAVIHQVSWETTQVILLILVPFFLFFLILTLFERLFISDVLCILAEERLYFFNQTVTRINPTTGRKRESVCSGSIDYEDIRHVEYVPAVRKWRPIMRYTTLVSESVLLQGTDCQIEIVRASKSLIRQIKRYLPNTEFSASHQPLPDFKSIQHDRNGIWEEIWTTMEANHGEGIFPEDTQIAYFHNDASLNSVEIDVVHKGREIVFHMDEDCLFMFDQEKNREKTVPLANIASIEELYSQMHSYLTESVSDT